MVRGEGYGRPVAATWRLIRLSRDGTCEQCHGAVPTGTRAWWSRGHPLVICTTCRPGQPSVPPAAADPAASTAPPAAAKAASPPVAEAAPQPSLQERRALIQVGAAGGSTLREYERRHDKREARIRKRWGRLAGIVLALSDDPSTTRAWARGSIGESKLAAALGKIDREDVVFLHDRRVPRTRSNIDHLVVAPTGIYVVDAKRYAGKVEVRNVAGLLRPPDHRLHVGHRDCSKLARAMGWQVDAVRAALGDRVDLSITPVLCFVDAEWPMFGGPEEFEGVRTEGSRSLRKLVTRPGPLTCDDVVDIAVVLSQQLPPYSPSQTVSSEPR